MKKIFLSLLLVILIILFSGCSSKPVDFRGKKTISCTNNTTGSESSTVTNFIFSYDNNNYIEDFGMKSVSTFINESAAKMMYNLFSSISLGARSSGIYLDSRLENNKVTIVMSGSYSKYAAIFGKMNSIIGKNVEGIPNATKSEIISGFTDSGYNCIEN